jgi:hypothetical protein
MGDISGEWLFGAGISFFEVSVYVGLEGIGFRV